MAIRFGLFIIFLIAAFFNKQPVF